MALLQRNNGNLLDRLKSKLEHLKEGANKSVAEEKFMLETLKTKFECANLKEAKELLDVLMSEQEEYETEINNRTESLLKEAKDEGII